MKNALILYFSGTGNTWWASAKLESLLSDRGFLSKSLSIEAAEAQVSAALGESDIVFLNYPIYGSDRPEIVKDFINNLPPAENKVFGIICTQLIFSGDGAWLEHDKIEAKGYRINWAMHLRMPNNVSVPGFPFRFTNNRDRINKTLEAAEHRLAKLADDVEAGRIRLQGTGRLSRALGLMQRAPYRKYLPKLRDDLSIEPANCSKCGLCIRYCPVDNIKFAAEQNGGFPEFQGNCILCLRCYNFCPGQAVMYRNTRFRPGRAGCEVPYRGPVENFKLSLIKPEKD